MPGPFYGSQARLVMGGQSPVAIKSGFVGTQGGPVMDELFGLRGHLLINNWIVYRKHNHSGNSSWWSECFHFISLCGACDQVLSGFCQ